MFNTLLAGGRQNVDHYRRIKRLPLYSGCVALQYKHNALGVITADNQTCASFPSRCSCNHTKEACANAELSTVSARYQHDVKKLSERLG
jgi:hypothetical protein